MTWPGGNLVTALKFCNWWLVLRRWIFSGYILHLAKTPIPTLIIFHIMYTTDWLRDIELFLLSTFVTLDLSHPLPSRGGYDMYSKPFIIRPLIRIGNIPLTSGKNPCHFYSEIPLPDQRRLLRLQTDCKRQESVRRNGSSNKRRSI